MENNLVYGVQTGMYHQHYGENNLIQNNILGVQPRNGQLQRTRVEARPAFTFRRNIVLWNGGPLLLGSWQPNTALDHNLYWDMAKSPVTFEGKTLAQWQAAGKDDGSLVADPGFVAPQRRDFAFKPGALKPGSPAARIGFQPFDPARAGVYGDAAWTASGPRLRLRAPRPRARTRRPPRRSSFHQDFEDLPVGAACPDAQTNGEGGGASIRVTDEAAASGAPQPQVHRRAGPRELLGPAPRLQRQPHGGRHDSGLRPARRGRARRSIHEWRDWRSQPYKTGPEFTIKGGQLLIGGNPADGRSPPASGSATTSARRSARARQGNGTSSSPCPARPRAGSTAWRTSARTSTP